MTWLFNYIYIYIYTAQLYGDYEETIVRIPVELPGLNGIRKGPRDFSVNEKGLLFSPSIQKAGLEPRDRFSTRMDRNGDIQSFPIRSISTYKYRFGNFGNHRPIVKELNIHGWLSGSRWMG